MDISIDYRTVLSLDLEGRSRISVAKGRLWVTREGDAADYFVARGERLDLAGGSWLVQALAPARFRCEDGSRRRQA
jgi:hypothetical protein